MHPGKAIFSQLTDWIHPEQFRRCVQRYDGDHRVHNFSCWEQFLAMTFAQLTYRDSWTDIEVCLRSRRDLLYRLGFRSTIYYRAQHLGERQSGTRLAHLCRPGAVAHRARPPGYAAAPIGVELAQTVYALDSTTIDLCRSLFPWARFRATKAAIKRHTRLDWRGPIPPMMAISAGKQADVRVLDELLPEPGACYVIDRGYVDFQRLYRFVLAGAFFVTRTKAGVQLNRLASRPVAKSTGVRSDHVVWLRPPEKCDALPQPAPPCQFQRPGERQGAGVSGQ